MRALLILAAGFLIGVAALLFFWPQPPSGVSAPPPSDVRVTISDTYLARVAASHIHALGPVAISKITLASSPPDELIARAAAGVGPLSAPVAIQLQPVARGGTVQVRLITVRIGDIPIPGTLAGVLGSTINSRLRSLLGHRASVVAVRVVPAGLQVYANYD